MARDNKINMPMGQGGLTRFFDDYKSNISLRPGHVIILVVVVILIEVFLYLKGNAMLGL